MNTGALIEAVTAAILILAFVGVASFARAKGRWDADFRRAVATAAADEGGQPPVAVPVRLHRD